MAEKPSRRTSGIPMSSPDLTRFEAAAVGRVLRTTRLSIGPQLVAFERAVSAFSGVPCAIGVSSGTAGLHLAVIAAGVEEGDFVITTPFSFIASSNAVLYERAVPIFVDVDRRTGNIHPERVAEAAEILIGGPGRRGWASLLPPSLRKAGRTKGKLKAILPVDALGQPADMDPILKSAGQCGVAVIEDSCEALGAEYKGRKAGSLGDAGVFAFYPNKQVTTGEGGMIVTKRNDWDRLTRSLRNQGRDMFDAWLNHARLGYNYRLDEMSAALGRAQMERIEALLARRDRVARWYNDRLSGLDFIDVPYVAPTTTRMSWFVYVIRLKHGSDRDEVMRRLGEKGIPSRPYFTPIHLQPYYVERFGYRRGNFPVTEHLGDVSLALPFSGVMPEGQVDDVCKELRRILERTTIRKTRKAEGTGHGH